MIPGATSSPARLGQHLLEYLLAMLMLTMLSLTCLQIVLRSGFAGGLPWIEPLVRQLVLWSGLLGAVLATMRGKHIAIDLSAQLIPARWRPLLQLACLLFAFIVCLALTYASWLFIKTEYVYAAPGLFGIASWWWNLIFPLCFLMMAASLLSQIRTALAEVIDRDHQC